MADVLIKGMEMPKTCRRCMEMEIPVRCRVIKEEPVTAVMSGYDRPSDCPLVELPPHGRLVDIDRMIADGRKGRKDVFPVDIESMDDLADFLETYADLDKTDNTVVVGASNDK